MRLLSIDCYLVDSPALRRLGLQPASLRKKTRKIRELTLRKTFLGVPQKRRTESLDLTIFFINKYPLTKKTLYLVALSCSLHPTYMPTNQHLSCKSFSLIGLSAGKIRTDVQRRINSYNNLQYRQFLKVPCNDFSLTKKNFLSRRLSEL